ncbi:uncharacterized protein LOC143246530 isoform X2 [Tachypleus tridentatus]
MRVLKLPRETKIGSIVYRLKGYDSDIPDILTFGVHGSGADFLEVRSASFTEADVILTKRPTEDQYRFTVFVTDGVETTEDESTVVITDATRILSPFLQYDSVIKLSENTAQNATITSVVAKDKDTSNLPVKFELRGSDKFSIKYVFGPRGTSKAKIVLIQNVDYEKQNLYRLQILALNAWTNETIDTRNIATVDIIVVVEDVQDSPPFFTELPNVVRVSESLKPGDKVLQIRAEDGDFGDQRAILYSFLPDIPWITFFTLNSTTGDITLAKPISELKQQYGTGLPLLLGVRAREVFSSGVPPAFIEAEVALVLVNTENHPPKFANARYVGSIEEGSPTLTAVRWEGATFARVIDEDQGKNGSFQLYLEGDAGTFNVQPSTGSNEVDFSILVKNPAAIDYENSDRKYLDFRILVRETQATVPLSATAEIRVNILDANDNIPQFNNIRYEASISENAEPGTLVTKVVATDKDSGNFGKVRYTSINGPIAQNLKLDPETGVITLQSLEGIDRERIPEYTLIVEARDDIGKGNKNVVELLLHLVDANDNVPTFLQPRYDAVLNTDMKTFNQRLIVKAYDADGPGPNSNVTYEIVSGNYEDKFHINSITGEITLKEPLIAKNQQGDTSKSNLPPITLNVRAHDHGVPVQSSTVDVQVHNQEYLNRTLSFIIPLSVEDVLDRKNEIERALNTLTGARVSIYSARPYNGSRVRSVAFAWVAYPLSSMINVATLENALSAIYGRQYVLQDKSEVREVRQEDYDIVFWFLIVFVILVLLLLLIWLICYCCYYRGRNRKNDVVTSPSKVGPSEEVITIKETSETDGRRTLRKQASNEDNMRVWRFNKHPDYDREELIRTDTGYVEHEGERGTPRDSHQQDTMNEDYSGRDNMGYRGDRVERIYRDMRGASEDGQVRIDDLPRDGASGQLVGNNYVVRRNIANRRRRGTDRYEMYRTEELDDMRYLDQDGRGHEPRRREILYLRSPVHEHDLQNVRYLEHNDDGLHRSNSQPDLYKERREYVNVQDQNVMHRSRPHRILYRDDSFRLDPRDNQLKFSRYHRTNSDVYLPNRGYDIYGQHIPNGRPQVAWTGNFILPEERYRRQGKPDPNDQVGGRWAAEERWEERFDENRRNQRNYDIQNNIQEREETEIFRYQMEQQGPSSQILHETNLEQSAVETSPHEPVKYETPKNDDSVDQTKINREYRYFNDGKELSLQDNQNVTSSVGVNEAYQGNIYQTEIESNRQYIAGLPDPPSGMNYVSKDEDVSRRENQNSFENNTQDVNREFIREIHIIKERPVVRMDSFERMSEYQKGSNNLYQIRQPNMGIGTNNPPNVFPQPGSGNQNIGNEDKRQETTQRNLQTEDNNEMENGNGWKDNHQQKRVEFSEMSNVQHYHANEKYNSIRPRDNINNTITSSTDQTTSNLGNDVPGKNLPESQPVYFSCDNTSNNNTVYQNSGGEVNKENLTNDTNNGIRGQEENHTTHESNKPHNHNSNRQHPGENSRNNADDVKSIQEQADDKSNSSNTLNNAASHKDKTSMNNSASESNLNLPQSEFLETGGHSSTKTSKSQNTSIQASNEINTRNNLNSQTDQKQMQDTNNYNSVHQSSEYNVKRHVSSDQNKQVESTEDNTVIRTIKESRTTVYETVIDPSIKNRHTNGIEVTKNISEKESRKFENSVISPTTNESNDRRVFDPLHATTTPNHKELQNKTKLDDIHKTYNQVDNGHSNGASEVNNATSKDGEVNVLVGSTNNNMQSNNDSDDIKLQQRQIHQQSEHVETRKIRRGSLDSSLELMENQTNLGLSHGNETLSDDSDSGIGRGNASINMRKNNFLEKKSLFTIAYDGIQTRQLKSQDGRINTP